MNSEEIRLAALIGNDGVLGLANLGLNVQNVTIRNGMVEVLLGCINGSNAGDVSSVLVARYSNYDKGILADFQSQANQNAIEAAALNCGHMEVKLVRRDDMLWTRELVDEIRPHAKHLGTTVEECDRILKCLARREQLRVIQDAEIGRKENYLIYHGEDISGVLTTINYDDGFWEFNLLIFADFRGKDSVARKAIDQLLACHPTRSWEANVYAENQFFPNMESILECTGFVSTGKSINGIVKFQNT